MNQKLKNFLKPIAIPLYNLLTRIELPFSSKKSLIDPQEAKKRLNDIWPFRPVEIHRKNEVLPNKNLTIIIPVYNVESYLKECLDSVLDQKTKYSYSVICVNDGSKDNSLNILEQYDGKVTIINQENGGLSKARNTGLAHIDGDYAMFLDSDDVLLPGAIEALLDIAYRENADIAEGKVEKFSSSWPKVNSKGKVNDLGNDFSLLRGFSVAKAIRSSLFENAIFPEGYYFEDSIMAYWIHPSSKKTFQTSREVYGYRQNPQSISFKAGTQPKCLDTVYISLDLWEKHIKEFGSSFFFNKIALRQIALNYQRILGLEKQYPSLEEDAFSLFKEAYLSMFPSPLKELKRREKLLDSAIRKSDYGQYRLICDRWNKLPTQ